MSNKKLTDDELLELGVDPDYNNRVDRWTTSSMRGPKRMISARTLKEVGLDRKRVAWTRTKVVDHIHLAQGFRRIFLRSVAL